MKEIYKMMSVDGKSLFFDPTLTSEKSYKDKDGNIFLGTKSIKTKKILLLNKMYQIKHQTACWIHKKILGYGCCEE